MMFSTKAEYGVRVMVELARRAGEDPIPLAEIAAHDGLPLAYLEHLVARLRKAGLVDSRRGSRGGYLLARSPTEITMAEVVRGARGLDRADRVHLPGLGRHDRVLARVRSRPRLPHEAAVDAGALCDRAHLAGDDARRPRARRPRCLNGIAPKPLTTGA